MLRFLRVFAILAVVLVSDPEMTSRDGVYGHGPAIYQMPFYQRLVETGVFDIRARYVRRPDKGNLNKLFFQATRFRYFHEHSQGHWQTPQETQKKGSGDCKDKTVWLYAALKQNGYKDVSIVIGKYRSFEKKYHVWLVYKDADHVTYLLDPAIQRRVWKLKDISAGFYNPSYFYEGKQEATGRLF